MGNVYNMVGGGGGNYRLQPKTVTPTKKQQNITPDAGYYGMSDVMVGAIPEAYQDVTSVTAVAADVLTGKTIVGKDGAVTAGTMANNGSVSASIDGLTATSVTVPAGYTTGGTIALTDDIENALAAV